jgi:hypothetical protein
MIGGQVVLIDQRSKKQVGVAQGDLESWVSKNYPSTGSVAAQATNANTQSAMKELEFFLRNGYWAQEVTERGLGAAMPNSLSVRGVCNSCPVVLGSCTVINPKKCKYDPCIGVFCIKAQ